MHRNDDIAWQPLAVHFRQKYDQGYRYLDNCGAFMLACETDLGLIPTDAKVTGATLEKPESGINVTVDSAEIKAAQENPTDEGEEFAQICAGLAELVQEHFPPALVFSNGFAWRCFRPFQRDVDVKAASLKFAGDSMQGIGKKLRMTPSHVHLHQGFSLGSRELTLQVDPITFERVTRQYHSPPLGANQRQRDVASRRNKRADRIVSPPPYGLSLHVDLVEKDPPLDSIPGHFQELLRCLSDILEEFS